MMGGNGEVEVSRAVVRVASAGLLLGERVEITIRRRMKGKVYDYCHQA
jgi:hypothetical protein